MKPFPILLAGLLPLTALRGLPVPAKRPNILFLFADDWGRYASIYATIDGRPSVNQVVRTPNIDRIAREGVLFRNAFAPAPSCTPCRSSLLSGQYFWRTGRGAILQGAVWDPAIPSFPLLLHAAGYDIGKTYKVWSPGVPKDAPYGGERYAYKKAGWTYNRFSQTATAMVRAGMTFAAAKQELLDQVRGNFAAFLASRKPGQPFCYWFGPTLTHRPYEKGSGRALWGIDPDALKGKLPKTLPDVPVVRSDFADYLGEVQAWDAAVGVLVDELRKTGELDHTFIVITGDQGIGGMPGAKCNLYDMGSSVALVVRGPGVRPGRVVNDFVNLMDLAPTFLQIGGVKPPAVMTGHGILGILRSGKSGQVDPARTWVVTGRERHVRAARKGDLPYPQRALRTPDFLYIRNFAPDRWPMGSPNFTRASDRPPAAVLEKNTFVSFADMDASPTKAWLIGQFGKPRWKWYYDYAFAKRPAEELYDLRTDPDETVNVAGDPRYAAIRAALSRRLLAVLERTGDPRLIDHGRYYETPPLAGPQPSGSRPRGE